MSWEEIEQEMEKDPVRSLQFMLNRLRQRYAALPELETDGQFGEKTLEAVMRFQKLMGLPVSGHVDGETARKLMEQWRTMEEALHHPRTLRGFPRGAVLEPGDSAPFLLPIQAMFESLRQTLEGIQPTQEYGIHTGTSVENARWLQRLAGLPETGQIDHALWNLLTRIYELFSVMEVEEHRWAQSLPGRG